MPTFAYVARGRDGSTQKGTLVANNRQALIQQLQARGLTANPSSIKEKGGKGNLSKKKVKAQEMLIFTRQLATMVNAGLPLLQCLDILAEQTDDETFATSGLVRHVHGLHALSRLQRDDTGIAYAPGAHGRDLPKVRRSHGHSHRTLREVHLVLDLSKMRRGHRPRQRRQQVAPAPATARDGRGLSEMRTGQATGSYEPGGRGVLRVRTLSEMSLYAPNGVKSSLSTSGL